MKVLILGSAGMLGHKLYQVLSTSFDVIGTIRGPYRAIARYGFFQKSQIVPDIDVLKTSRLERLFEETKPDVVISAVGIVKSLEEKMGTMLNIQVNSLLPHQIYALCQAHGARFIHVSTDCVFSGKKGNYREDDPSDAEDIYGKTKYLGEVKDKGALTIRTSFIGRELGSSNGLLEWFISNRGGRVNGYTNAIFSGFPSLHLSRIIADIIVHHPELTGLYHVSSDPISKCDLLSLINKALGLNIQIDKYPDFHSDRSLDSTRFRRATGFKPLPWDKMIEELGEDARQYQEIR